ncbi:MAG: sodium:solute symporter [Sumerlaeia bacterium]
MTGLDWLVLVLTIGAIVLAGTLLKRRHDGMDEYLRGGNQLKWGTIGLSVMATQASAITFLSTPGQGYEHGMAFVQNYLGLPIALVIISVFIIPIYYRLKVYTAYEYLGNRFDVKTRILGSILFLVQRGLAAGITIYAPAIILSTLLNWDLQLTIIMTGLLVITYTVSGGTRAVSLTQKYQMGVIFAGMVISFIYLVNGIAEHATLTQATHLAGSMGRLEAVNFSLDPRERYTIWTGLLGGTFLALSYFGTDQSQVQRYITGTKMEEGRAGLMFNAVLKIPMQFGILFMGAMLFVFYQFNQPPIFFNQVAYQTVPAEARAEFEVQADELFSARQIVLKEYLDSTSAAARTNRLQQLEELDSQTEVLRSAFLEQMRQVDPNVETEDADYVFLTFVLTMLPAGIVGLLIAVIFSAAMSSTSSELNALASTSTIDLYAVLSGRTVETIPVWVSQGLTLLWGVIAITFALTVTLFDNLIEAVNIVGSIFYGTILGIFLAGFFIRWIQGNAIFTAAIITQLTVFVLFSTTNIGYLWYNVIGCVLVISTASVFQLVLKK